MTEAFVVFKIIQGQGWSGTQLVTVLDSEQSAKHRCRELDLQLQSLLSADLVQGQGDGKAVSLGMKASNLLGSVGVMQVGHAYTKAEIQSDIVVAQPRILRPVT